MKSALFAAVTLAAFHFSGEAGAQSAIEETVLLKHKSWMVEHEYFTSTGSQGCSAATANRLGDMFEIHSTAEGTVTLYLWMGADFKDWSGSFTDDMILHIDYKTWTLNDAGFKTDGQMRWVRFAFPPGDSFTRFLKDIYAGSAVALKTPSGTKTISTWSLAGSAAALLKLAECTDRISAAADTYGSGRDTYGGNSDTYGSSY
ncbi:hypothetical protein [Roseobacter sp.]|uniref:hypothetical protein n=1 Tax=Roseobacter sp. TaxID=1907202 RepID=UPI0025DE40EE|nr:hypothetical protein [Roseobacter sp.]